MKTPIDRFPTATRHELKSFVTEWLNADGIPGASVAVVRDDKVSFADGFGARNLDENEPATHETLYGIGSCTKSFTALAIIQHVEAGDLDPDDPVAKYVPYLDEVEGESVTVHELLTHTSRMPSDGSAVVLIVRLTGTDPLEVSLSSEADFRRHLEGSLPERVSNDDQFFYYNTGYTILGHVVEEVTGTAFAEYVESEILDPRGMSRSPFSMDEVNADRDRLTPYYTEDDSIVEGEFPDDEMIYAPEAS